MEGHWTERSIEDYHFRIASDFISQLEEKMEDDGISQVELAKLTGLSKGRISQVINNPGNITVKIIVKFARALGLKVSLLAYNDGDPGNTRGPINSEIFRICWENSGKPLDFWSVQEAFGNRQSASSSNGTYWTLTPDYVQGAITETADSGSGGTRVYHVNT